ncbi:methylated-DNA--[protein]-cysteine S-methyltransferase [Actinoplanes sp. NPDC051633]|uniref:methylated-DNA--[protein]-cysteine S-methyltransferase n=1 Tax=Actinoplanes sp. NPDC051633 TaxID=3155670 RepID=UPI003449FB2E
MHYSTMATPAGSFTAVVDDDGAVLASGFTADPTDLIALMHPTLVADAKPEAHLGDVTRAVKSYLEGDLTAIDDVPVRQHIGGTFIAHAWRVMRDIKPGAPVTYTAFAELAGRPEAIRGAASACARNAAALFVPCHRVLRLDGSLGGYRWGLPVKRWLLDHEKDPAA